ncbi:DUF4112 domain-containing protein [Aliiroseovarius sp. YM-037]|uniref:DUF4112 domain-containing protein n=1 Tax=Aliiroseovarius sp. YM-037 TaxID=3341728 RepID=UPI003A805ADA
MDELTKRELKRLESVAHGLENLLPLPGTQMRVGLDALFGLFPVVGDVLGLAPAAYIIHRAHRLGAPRRLVIRMAMNVIVDAALGAVPVLGDIFDVGWKANTRNVSLLRVHLEMKTAHAETARTAILINPESA